MAALDREHVKQILEYAQDLSRPERNRFLDEACCGNEALREEIESLLPHAGKASDLIESVVKGIWELPEETKKEMNDFDHHLGQHYGKYEIVERIGSGGMGRVYQAVDKQLKRTVALKFIADIYDTDSEVIRRFKREARLASALDHVNIGTIYELGETGQGIPFIAMAYYEGESLKAVIDRGPLNIDTACGYIIQIAKGLSVAHTKGIVHRDIKPSNLIINREGTLKIVDFGLAKADGKSQITKSGTLLGTVAYMSPEQILNNEVDARTDLWSLGVVFYEMISGKRPFEGAFETASAYNVLHTEPVELATLNPRTPESVAHCVRELLQKDKEKRPATAEDVLSLLGHAQSEGRSWLYLPQRPKFKKHLYWTPIAVIFLVIVALGLLQIRPLVVDNSERKQGPLQTMVILPFSVQDDSSLQYLESGMVSLLSQKIDGVGRLRSVDYQRLQGFIEKQDTQIIDPGFGGQAAVHFGADAFVLGAITKQGKSVLISATLFDTAGNILEQTEVLVASDHLFFQAIDALASQLVAALYPEATDKLEATAALTTASFAALKAYLQGEHALHSGHYTNAYSALTRAVKEDSTFAIAWYRLADAAGGENNPRNKILPAIEKAVQYKDKLPMQIQYQVMAEYAVHLGHANEAERIYKLLLSIDPMDAMTWYKYADLLFHYNRVRGRSKSETRLYFEKVLTLDPGNKEVLLHGTELAVKEKRFDDLDTLVSLLVRPTPQNRIPGYLDLIRSIGGMDVSKKAEAVQTIKSLGIHPTYYVILEVATAFKDIDLAMELALWLAENDSINTGPFNGFYQVGIYHLAKGQTQPALDAFEKAFSNNSFYPSAPHRIWTMNLLNANLSSMPETLFDSIVQWDSTRTGWWLRDDLMKGRQELVKKYLIGLASWHRSEFNTLEKQVSLLDSMYTSKSQDSLAYSLARRLEALHRWGQQDISGAIESVEAASFQFPYWKSRPWGLYEDPFVYHLKGELYFANGEYSEAIRWYSMIEEVNRDPRELIYLIYLGPTYLRKAQSYDRLGQTQDAIQYYKKFIHLWKDTDAELLPYVQVAQERLEALTE